MTDRLPGPAGELTVISVTSTQVLLSWSPPSFNADSVRSYVVQYWPHHASGTDYYRNDMVEVAYICFIVPVVTIHHHQQQQQHF